MIIIHMIIIRVSRAWWVVSLVAVAGCELIFAPGGGDTIDGGGGDAGDRDGDPTDAAIDGPAMGPFGAALPVVVTGHPTTPNHYITDVALLGDESQLAFVEVESGASDSAEIYIAYIKTEARSWSGPDLLEINNPSRNDTNPKLSADGLVMWSARGAVSAGDADIRAWKRTQPSSMTFVDADAEHAVGFPTGSDERPGGPVGVERMVITLGESTSADFAEFVFAGGAWTATMTDTLATLNSDPALIDLANAHLAPDGLTLVFASATAGPNGTDLFRATRTSVTDAFDAPTPIAELNTTAQEGDPWLSHDGRRIWFSRVGGELPLSAWGIYYADR